SPASTTSPPSPPTRPATSPSTRVSSACAWSRRPSTRTTSRPTICFTATAGRAREATSPSSTGRSNAIAVATMPSHVRGTPAPAVRGPGVASRATRDWWAPRLTDAYAGHEGIADRDGRAVLDFEDAEGQRLAVIDDGGHGDAHPWTASPIPAGHQIRGLGPITLSGPDLAPTDGLLTTLMNMRRVRDYRQAVGGDHVVHVYELGNGG